MTTEMLGHAVPMFMTAFLTDVWKKLKPVPNALDTLYKEEKCGIHVVSKINCENQAVGFNFCLLLHSSDQSWF